MIIIAAVWLLIVMLTIGFYWRDIINSCDSAHEAQVVFPLFIFLSIIMGPLMTALLIGNSIRKNIRGE